MIKGSIREQSFDKLLEKIIKHQFKGHILFTSGMSRREIFFENKYVTGSSSNDPSDYLGQYLINEGIITLEQFNRAYRTELETEVKMGAILKLIGLAPIDKIREAMINKIIDTSFIISCWQEGSYEVLDDYPLNSSEVEIKIPVDEIVKHLTARQQELTETISMYHLLGEHPGISILDKDIKKLRKLDQQIINLISIGKTLRETIGSIPVHFYVVSRHILSLYRNTILLPGKGAAISEDEFFKRLVSASGHEAPREMTAISREDTMNIFRLAEESMAAGNFWKAASYYRVLYNINPHNIVFKDSLANAEYNYTLFFYREIFSPSTKIIKGEGTGIISDPIEDKIIALMLKNAFTVRDIVVYFLDQNSEVNILNAIERLAQKGYLVKAPVEQAPQESDT